MLPRTILKLPLGDLGHAALKTANATAGRAGSGVGNIGVSDADMFPGNINETTMAIVFVF